jgi:hypothetical protein
MKHALFKWIHDKPGTGFRDRNPFPMLHAGNMQSVHAKRARKEDAIGGGEYLENGQNERVI